MSSPYENPFGQPQFQGGQAPGPVFPAPVQPPAYAPKSKVAAALLAFFLGTLGVHDFYLGYTATGVTKLVLSIFGGLTSVLLIGIPFIAAVGIWAFIDFICILTSSGKMAHDSNGVLLS